MKRFKLVAGLRYKVLGTTNSQTTITVQNLLSRSGAPLTMDVFGDIGYATLDPGNSFMELISFTGISGNTLTGVTRGLRFEYPYDADTSLRKSHSLGSVLIFSNPPQVYDKFASKINEENVEEKWTFDKHPEASTYVAPTEDTEYAPKKYVDDIAIAGSPTASETVKGITKISVEPEDEPVAVGQNDPRVPYILEATRVGVTDTYNASNPLITELVNGMMFSVTFNVNNNWSSGQTKLKINSFPAMDIRSGRRSDEAIPRSALWADVPILLIYREVSGDGIFTPASPYLLSFELRSQLTAGHISDYTVGEATDLHMHNDAYSQKYKGGSFSDNSVLGPVHVDLANYPTLTEGTTFSGTAGAAGIHASNDELMRLYARDGASVTVEHFNYSVSSVGVSEIRSFFPMGDKFVISFFIGREVRYSIDSSSEFYLRFGSSSNYLSIERPSGQSNLYLRSRVSGANTDIIANKWITQSPGAYITFEADRDTNLVQCYMNASYLGTLPISGSGGTGNVEAYFTSDSIDVQSVALHPIINWWSSR